MNLELEKIKKEIAELKILIVQKPVRFFRVHYELELLEAIQITKLFEDMVHSEQAIPLHKVYVCFDETHHTMFDNPILKLSKYSYKITFWISLHKPMDQTIFDKYFDKKLGKACSEAIQRYDTFLEMANLEKAKINKYYTVTLFGFIEEHKVPKQLTI